MIALGALGVGAAGWAYYDEWNTRQTWEGSPEAYALARQQAEPTPVWIAPAPSDWTLASEPTIEAVPTPGPAPDTVVTTPTPVVTAEAEQLSLDAADFRFLDPPEPGAHARIAVNVTNHAHVGSGRILLGIDSSWLEDYKIIGTAPTVSADRTDESGLRTFSFPPIPAGSSAHFELHVTASDEGTRAPSVEVLLDSGDVVGSIDRPTTFAPKPRPGPVMSIDIPRLKLHGGVVQTAWEPPSFSVGQIKGSANITQGNTVLIGHLTGAAGNVFAHLDQLEPGDEITAVSRGLPYKFVVSQTFESGNNDVAPMQPEDDARLTLMTCAGVWNPFTRDYSQRLWVIAEPPDQAAATIANVSATATAVTQATATAVAALPTETPVPVPTPYRGEPSLTGGLGNTRGDLEKAFGGATGETSGKLVVFKAAAGREVRVRFSPDPPRALLVSEAFSAALTFDAAVAESRKLFPRDASPVETAPEGNAKIVVERFTSASLAQAVGDGDFAVIYSRDAKGGISAVLVGRGDDIDALQTDARR